MVGSGSASSFARAAGVAENARVDMAGRSVRESGLAANTRLDNMIYAVARKSAPYGMHQEGEEVWSW